MSRVLLYAVLCACTLLASACSKRERSDPNAEEWADIEAMADDAQVVPAPGSATSPPPEEASEPEPDDEFAAFSRRLNTMKTVERGAGQTLLTGDKLVFDQLARVVQMDGNVLVEDDQGELRAERLMGRFSEMNQVEHIEAEGGVSIVSGDRKARADAAVYRYLEGTVQLDGQAVVSAGNNQLSGERIRFWISGARKMVCEPNALLLIAGQSGLAEADFPDEIGETEIRANRIVYDESRQQADALGGVRLRNPQLAMNCGEIHLFIKDNSEIDWIEAVSEVIIQSEDRKALADKAIYEADEGKFTLEGHPMVKQGPNVMTGDRIYFWHRTRSVLCEPNGRVLYYYDLDAQTRARFPEDLED